MKLVESKEEKKERIKEEKQAAEQLQNAQKTEKEIARANRKAFLSGNKPIPTPDDITENNGKITIKTVKTSSFHTNNVFVFRKNPKGSEDVVYKRFVKFIKSIPFIDKGFLNEVVTNRESFSAECVYFAFYDGMIKETRAEDECEAREKTTYYGKEGYDGEIHLSHKTETYYVRTGRKIYKTYDVAKTKCMFDKSFYTEKDFDKNHLTNDDSVNLITIDQFDSKLDTIHQVICFPVWMITVSYNGAETVNFMSDFTLKMSFSQGQNGILGKINLPLIATKKVRANVVDRSNLLSRIISNVGLIASYASLALIIFNFGFLKSVLDSGFFVVLAEIIIFFASSFSPFYFKAPIFSYGTKEQFYLPKLIREYRRGRRFRFISALINLIGIAATAVLLYGLYDAGQLGF